MFKLLKRGTALLVLIIGILWLYANSLIGVNPKTKFYLQTLAKELKQKNYEPNYFVISGRRWVFDNYLLNKFGGAAKKSQHLQGNAIDIIVLDVNNDKEINGKDVDLIYTILNKKIIQNGGGIGTYKKQSGFFNQQMVHFDCRGNRARWKK